MSSESSAPLTEFERAVDGVLRSLGPGELATYGEVASEAGYPGRARAVGRILAGSDGDYPWWRVVNSSGRLVPGHEREQGRRLRLEGVAVAEGRVASFGRHTGAPKVTTSRIRRTNSRTYNTGEP